MTYKNAKDVLPHELLQQLQQYAAGEILYVPADGSVRGQWGNRSGARDQYRRRNQQICQLYSQNCSVEELAQRFYLSADSIRKIIRQNGKAKGKEGV